ncbi:MAG: hypothetical protein HFH24_13115 [Ruminococcus sp.]|nr:hypothetical protein [Ruminococcus sp.]
MNERRRFSWAAVLEVVAGSVIMGISIDLFVRAGWGLDSLSLFQAGLGNVFHISLGTASISIMLLVLVILFFIDRKRIGLGTVLNSLLVGTSIHFFSPVICTGTPGMGERILCLAAALVLMGVGIGTYVAAGIGEAGMDAIMIYLSSKFKKNVNGTRVLMDISLSAVGFLLGGELGVATIISMLINGQIIQMTLKMFEKIRKSKGSGIPAQHSGRIEEKG